MNPAPNTWQEPYRRVEHGDTGIPRLSLSRNERWSPKDTSASPTVPKPRPASAFVKGFRTPASHWREGMHGGRRPKSLEGGNRGGSSHRRWCRSMGNLPALVDLICWFQTGRRRLSDQRG